MKMKTIWGIDTLQRHDYVKKKNRVEKAIEEWKGLVGTSVTNFNRTLQEEIALLEKISFSAYSTLKLLKGFMEHDGFLVAECGHLTNKDSRSVLTDGRVKHINCPFASDSELIISSC